MSQPNTDVLDLKQILVQFNSKCIDIYEARHTYSKAELITADLDKELETALCKIQELYILKSDVEEAIGEDGRHERARMSEHYLDARYKLRREIRTKLNLNKES